MALSAGFDETCAALEAPLAGGIRGVILDEVSKAKSFDRASQAARTIALRNPLPRGQPVRLRCREQSFLETSMRRMPLLFPLIVWPLAVSGQAPEANRTGAAGAREPASGR